MLVAVEVENSQWPYSAGAQKIKEGHCSQRLKHTGLSGNNGSLTMADMGGRNQTKFWSPPCWVRASPAVQGPVLLVYFSGAAQQGQDPSALHFHLSQDTHCFPALLGYPGCKEKTSPEQEDRNNNSVVKSRHCQMCGVCLTVLAHVISLKQGKSRMSIYEKAFPSKC